MKFLPDAIWVSGQELFIFIILVLNIILTYLCWWRHVEGDMTKSRGQFSRSVWGQGPELKHMLVLQVHTSIPGSWHGSWVDPHACMANLFSFSQPHCCDLILWFPTDAFVTSPSYKASCCFLGVTVASCEQGVFSSYYRKISLFGVMLHDLGCCVLVGELT